MAGESGRHGDDEPREEDFVFVGPTEDLESRIAAAQDEFGRLLDEMKRLAKESDPTEKSPEELRELRRRYRGLKARQDELVMELHDLKEERDR